MAATAAETASTATETADPDFFMASDLPESLDDGVAIAVNSTLMMLNEAGDTNRIRIEFDPTADAMKEFHSLKQSQEFVLNYLRRIALHLLPEKEGEKEGTVRVFLPDHGWAALMRRDWRIDTPESLMPSCVKIAALTGDKPDYSTDRAIVLLSPELTDPMQQLWEELKEHPDLPVILVNPGYDNRPALHYQALARNLRDELTTETETVWYLRVYSWGCVARFWPLRYSVWLQDPRYQSQGGYRLVQTYASRPTRNMVLKAVDNAINEMTPQKEEGANPLKAMASGVSNILSTMGKITGTLERMNE